MKVQWLYLALFVVFTSCEAQKKINENQEDMNNIENEEIAVLGAGCFWCVEAVFQDLKGVYKVESGYSGGHVKNPSYKEVCADTTGHAEVVKITFNPNEIAFETILSVFFVVHDPTTLNYQGNDHGTQYRSAIFYTTEKQKESSERIISELNAEGAYRYPIVTEVTPFDKFYKAEDYHQDYYSKNPEQAYCNLVIKPKMEKMKKVFKDLLIEY